MSEFWRCWREDRPLLFEMIRLEMTKKVSDRTLGPLWWLLEPVLMMFVYSFVVGQVLGRGGDRYGPFVLAGLMGWQWFAKVIGMTVPAFVQGSGVLTRTRVRPFSLILGPAVAHGALTVIGFGVVSAFSGQLPGASVVVLPLVMAIQLLFTLGLGTIFALACVAFPDVQNLSTFLLRAWWFLSPVLYDARWVAESATIPAFAKSLFAANPFATFLDAYRAILLEGRFPDATGLVAWAVGSMLLLFAALRWLDAASVELRKKV